MPVTTWNTTVIDGERMLVIDIAKLRVPLDRNPNGFVFLAVSAPDGIDGDALFGYPALAQGDPGPAATLDADVNLTVLDYDDPAADSASWTELSPGVYQYNTTQRRGPQGPPGANTIIGSTDLAGTPFAGRHIAVNATADGAVFVSEKVGDWYIPSATGVYDTPSGNPTFTLTTVAVPAQPNDWRPTVEASTIVTAAGGTDVVTDLVARLNTTGGNEVGRCFGMAPTERLILTPGPPAGSPDGWDRVAAGVPANVLVRVERRTGTNTMTTSKDTTRIRVKADPIP